jgi:uncharacterized membrane protein
MVIRIFLCERRPAPCLKDPMTAVANRAGHTGGVRITSQDDEPARQDPARHERPESRDGQVDSPADSALILEGIHALHGRLDEFERRIAPSERSSQGEGQPPGEGGKPGFMPAWKRPTDGEARWQAAAAVAAAVALQLPLPDRLVLLRPAWLLPAVEGLLLLVLVMANPHRINRESRALRLLGLALAALLSLANTWSVVRLVIGLVQGTEGGTAGPLLVTGGAIWLTNIIIFGLWYWEFDRGGPVARANATRVYPDFQFVQMASPQLAPPDWEPTFGDYLYLSFTNAAAFSPTDVMPLSRWAKMAMTAQATVSIVTVALVVARAVNILR